jgi:aminoglycoside phosphotransferase (APT) family kinase protein
VPERVRAAVEEWLGSPVVCAASQSAGFSPGVAARLRTADGRRVFVKAVGLEANALTPAAHRREAEVAAALPEEAPVPRLLWSHDEGEGGWVVLLFEDIEGRNPTLPWRDEELGRTLDALKDLADLLTPSLLPPEGMVGHASEWEVVGGRQWRRLVEERPAGLDGWSERNLAALADLEVEAPAAAAGDTLLHLDLRADNLLLSEERVLVVDWPHARVGASWVDAAFFAPSAAMQDGPQPEELMERLPQARRADPDALTAVITAVAGFFTGGACGRRLRG